MIDTSRAVRFTYTNNRGQTGTRRVVPLAIAFDRNEWNPEEQWLMTGWDLDRQALRVFAMKLIRDWAPDPQ
jgi:predicted DNA-binding transcriptional regulator YafY